MTMRRTFMKTVATMAIAAMGLGVASMAAAEELDTIREAGVIRIAMSGAYPPFNFVNDQNEVVGFDPAIGTEIARRMGLEVEIVTTAWDGDHRGPSDQPVRRHRGVHVDHARA